MTPQQIELVRESWRLVLPISDTAATLFYQRLFELDPNLKPMFLHDMREQGRKLMSTIDVAVKSLNNLSSIVPAVQELGRRHAGYGVKEKDYQTVAEALIWTLQRGLGNSFTDATKQAWIETYSLLSKTMIDAAKTIPA